MKVATHKGIDIDYNPQTEIFSTVENDDFNADAKSLGALKQKIDAGTREKFDRIDVIFKAYSDYEEGTLTSFQKDKNEGWVTSKEKNRHRQRRKVYGHQIFLKTDENVRILQEIREIEKQANALYKKQQSLEKQLKPYSGERLRL